MFKVFKVLRSFWGINMQACCMLRGFIKKNNFIFILYFFNYKDM